MVDGAARRRAGLRALLAVVLAMSGVACAPDVTVRRVDPATTLRDQLRTRLVSGELSSFTRNALGQLDLRAAARTDPVAAAERLAALAADEPDAPWRLAAAELYLDAAERTAPGDPSLDLACAQQADLEIARAIAEQGGLLDTRTEFAADLLHRAVSRFVDATQERWLDGAAVVVEGAGGRFRVALAAPDDRRWDPRRFDALQPTDGLRVDGMRNHHRLDAYGAPVVAIREQRDAEPPRSDPFRPPEGAIEPATVTLAFDGDDVSIELWRIDRVATIQRHGGALRLSTDVTAPIGVLFGRTELGREARRGMTEVGSGLRRIGVYLHEPYDPEKIPVLMVHGLRSSPLTWRDLLNDLQADPRIRANYQFWMFLYPSGLPVPRSASYLREHLARVRDHFDPHRDDPGMRRMVVIGHSMGGLLTKALVQTSGDALWNSLHPVPFQSLAAPAEVRDHLETVFFYDADPDVQRVVFIATPHRGSRIASSFVGRLGDALVELPRDLTRIDEWFDGEADRVDATEAHQVTRGVPSSIDDLQPDAPHLRAYLETPIREGVRVHTIIGAARGDSDGVVPVESARLADADSELVVAAGHDAHMHPLAIREVRRILLEHLEAAGR